MRARLALAVLLLCGAAAAPLAAQARPTPAAVSASRNTDGAESSAHGRWRIDQCMGGVTYGAPLKWAASYGLGLASESPDNDWCLLTAGKIGLGGAGFHVGAATAFGPFGSGAALTGGVIRTFDRPLNALARRTYVGASLHGWLIMAIGGEIGYYRRVGTDPAGMSTARGLIVWSTGVGF